MCTWCCFPCPALRRVLWWQSCLRFWKCGFWQVLCKHPGSNYQGHTSPTLSLSAFSDDLVSHHRSLPAFHPLLLLSVCISIICPQNCKSWADLYPQPVWVRMISTLQRKEMAEFIPNLSASSLNTSDKVKKLRLPLSRHIVTFTLTPVSEGNGQFQLFF